jgi:hypothetical protein
MSRLRRLIRALALRGLMQPIRVADGSASALPASRAEPRADPRHTASICCGVEAGATCRLDKDGDCRPSFGVFMSYVVRRQREQF